jgi:RNA polymerase sigma factor (sigma-70 family)
MSNHPHPPDTVAGDPIPPGDPPQPARVDDAFYTRVFARATKRASRWTNDKDLAKDVAQDVTLELFSAASTTPELLTDANCLERAIVQRVTAVLAIQKRSNKRIHARGKQWHEELGTVSYGLNTEQYVEFRETRRLVCEAIDTMNPNMAQTYQLVRSQGYTYKEVSEITGRPFETVRSDLRRANTIVCAYVKSRIDDRSVS